MKGQLFVAAIGEIARLILAVIMIGQNVYVNFFLMQHPMPDTAKDLQLLIVNGSALLAGIAVNYYLGSSAGSAAKERTLNQQGKP